MKNESVAILDIRSNEISFLLGAKGVNGMFVISGIHVERYEGFCLDGFFDEEVFRRAVVRAVSAVQQNYKGTIDKIYVGVPSAFVSVVTKGQTIAFDSKRKLSSQDIDTLFDHGLDELALSGRCVRRSAMYFTLGDNRKYFSVDDLYGMHTTMLKGGLCYYFVSEYFYEIIQGLMESMSFSDVEFIPSTLAQSIYLLPEKKREGYAFLLDIGFVTSSLSVVYGNGIVHEENFNCGIASVLVGLIQGLEVDFNVAEEMLAGANISGGNETEYVTHSTAGEEYSIPSNRINDAIKCAVDQLCERLDVFLQKYYREKNSATMSVNPISVTGEGIWGIKGIAEHIEKRIGWVTETVYPDLPFYDKPTASSKISLLNMALNDQMKTTGIWQRLLKRLGGKKS